MNRALSICITGPESTGKTTLASAVNRHFKSGIVTEYARQYLAELSRPYTSEDLVHIANQQYKHILASAQEADIVIADTGVEVVKVWHEEKFGSSQELLELANQQHAIIDLYVLCTPDIPWEPDPLRESKHDRQRLFHLYEEYFKSESLPYVVIEGSFEKRINNLKEAIEFLA